MTTRPSLAYQRQKQDIAALVMAVASYTKRDTVKQLERKRRKEMERKTE